MSHLQRIEELVEGLNKSTIESGPSIKNMGDTKEIAIEIGSEVMDYVSFKDIDYICSILFSPDKGITRFLRGFAASKDYDIISAQVVLLGFITTFIKKAKSSLQIYASDIKGCCVQLAATGSARVRTVAIDALIAMLDTRISHLDTSALNIASIYRRFSDMYTLPPTRLPVSVKAKVIELLGTIARFYPNLLNQNDPQILKRWCLDSLDYILNNTSNDYAFISGAVNCLNTLLSSKNHLIEPESRESDRLFNILLKLLYIPPDINRYTDTIAALELFTSHTHLFTNLILPNCEKLYKFLQICSTHQNRLVFKYGTFAYDKFLIALTEILCKNIDGDRERSVFLFFMNDFMQSLELGNDLEHFYQTSAAIRGIGYFSKVCAHMLSKEEVENLCAELVRKSNWFYSDMNAEQHEYLRHLPSFLRAYSSFAGQLKSVPNELIVSLYHMCDIFILNFVRMSGYHRVQGSAAIVGLLGMLYQRGEGVLRKFLNRFIDKALIYTCMDVEMPDGGTRHAYLDLLYFWETLLAKKSVKRLITNPISLTEDEDSNEQVEQSESDEAAMSLDPEQPQSSSLPFLQVLYDVFFSSFLHMMKSFNLSLMNTEADDAEETNLNIITNTLRPINQKDFLIFQNFIEFWCMLLKKLENERLFDCMYILGTSIIDQSIQHPLVSGFYKMLAEMLAIAKKNHIFDNCRKHYIDSELMDEREEEKQDVYVTYLAFQGYVKEIWYRLQQFTDDLLASCLRLVLIYATAFFSVEELISPLEKALHLGITYNPLAVVAMDTLDELIASKAEYEIDDTFLSRILPCINEYLLIGMVNTSEYEDSTGIGGMKKRPYKMLTAAQRRYEAVKITTRKSELGVATSEYTSLQELQLRMMRFLGRLGGKNKQLLINDKDGMQKNDMLAWDPVKRLKIHLPFQNAKVDIYMDEFLPRICELAESSPDRRVKVAACESLHSLIILMLGNSALQIRNTRNSIETNYYKLYVRIFPIMLCLAIDPDQVARDMFRLLNSQIIHWFTNNAYYENPETTALLQALLNASCNSDASLRDYGAECIQEFVKWSIKQTSRATDGAQNIKSLLKRLYNLMSHPSAIQRFGAALVFNRIYRLFREESVLVNEYTLEILGQLFFSLKLSDSDHPSMGTHDQIIEAISHVKRILREKTSIFLESNPMRRPFLGDDKVCDLPSVVTWAFHESGKHQRAYAKACINFFSEFVLKLPAVETGKQWLLKQMNQDPFFLTNIFETNHLEPPSVFILEEKLMTTYSSWISQLNVTVDGYIWLTERNIIDLAELLSQGSSVFLEAVSYFIRNAPEDVLQDKIEQNTIEKTKMRSLYCYISARLVYLFDLLIKSPENGATCYLLINNNVSDILLHERFADVVANILLFPKKLSEDIEASQRNTVTNSSTSRIFHLAKHFMLTAHKKSYTALVDNIIQSMARIIISSDTSLAISLDDSRGRSSLVAMIGTAEAIEFVQSIGLLDLLCQKANEIEKKHPSTSNGYCSTLFSHYLTYHKINTEPLWTELLGKMISISFAQPELVVEEASIFLDFSGTCDISDAEKLSIFQKYRQHVYDAIAYNFAKVSTLFIENISHPLVADYLVLLFGYYKENRISHRKAVASITDFLIEDPALLEAMVSEWNTSEKKLNLITCLELLFGADPGILIRAKRKRIFDFLFESFLKLLQKDNSNEVIRNALDLLPVFITLDGPYLEKITDALQISVVSQFPAVSAELSVGTRIYNEYIAVLDKLLNVMVSFKSVPIFKLLKGTFVQEEHHIHEQKIRDSIAKFSKNLGLFSFLDVTQACFEQFKDKSILIVHRQNIISLVTSMLPLADSGHVSAFFEKNIVDIMDIIMRPPLLHGTNLQHVADMKERSSCFKLVQALYELLPSELVSGPGSQISITYEKQKEKTLQGKMMTMELLKKARSARQEGSESEKDEVYEARLEYNQAAYTVAAAIILRTQKTPKKSEAFYDGFLFREDPDYGIWNNIFDRRKELHLQLVLDQNLEKIKLKETKANMYKTEKNTTTHFASSALNGSSFTQPSLSEIILQNSLESSDVATPLESSNSFNNDVEMTEATLGSNDDDDDFLFEIDVFNENPCMRSLREIIEKLHTLIAPPEEEEPTTMPSWMNRLHKSFTSSSISLTTKLYLAKVIINYPIAFEKYALFWIEHLMELVTRGEEYGEPLNYFVQDLCIIIIAWGRHTRLPQNRESKHGLFNFISYLIKHVYHETPRVIRSNLYILRSIFSNWGQDIVVPTKLIYDELSYTGDRLTRSMVGLQLVSIILDHGINPYYDGPEVELGGLTELHFYDAISNNIFNKSKKGKSISVAAAEVMGFVMKYMKNNNMILKDDIEDMFTSKLQSASRIKGREDVFVGCMNALCKHDTELGQPLLPVVIHSLPQYAGVQRTEAVNVITACWKNDPMFLHTLKNSGIVALIMHRDSNTQVAVLSLLNKIFDILTDQDISEMVELMVQACPEHENLECKKLYYSFLKKAFTPPRADRSLQERLKVYIYRGLLDKDRSISDDIFDYIECTYQLEEDIYKALLKITRNLYTPETEDIYLLYCTQMMLRKAKRSHEYEKPIFENPLPNARFDANYYKLDTSWQKNFSMTPLFVPTQEETMNAEDIELNIRNTQRSLEFTRTQTLAGSLFSTFNPLQAQEADANESQNESILDKYIDSEEARERAPSIKDNYAQMRFIKSKKGAINRYHATRNEELKKKLLYLQSIRKEVQDKKVTLCRSYRVGDLPDIQITYKDLLIPLEVLSSADHSISRLLFSSIVIGVVNENEREEYKEQVAQCITNNLYESSLFFIPTIGSFLRIFFELDITNIESKLIKKVSSKSFNQHIGISLLEKQLLIGDTSEKASKRRKTGSSAQLSGEKSKWIDLSLLFKDIDESGVFRSIYQSYVATYEIPKKAIDSEVLGDYATAYNQFGQAKESLHNFVDQSEAHLWQEQMLHCYEKLTQWDDIVKDIYAAIPHRDYNKLWESEYQDPYLYYFMRSFTKQRNGVTDEEGNEIPWSDENPNPLFSFIEKALKNSNQRQYMLRHYSCDVTLASIYQKKYDQGGQFIRKSYESLLTAWTTLHPLAHTSRLAKLADLERTVELEDYIDLAIDIKKRGIDNSKINTFLQALTTRYPDPRIDPIDLWDDIIESRMVFIEDILSLAEEKNQNLTIDSTKFKIVFLNNIIDAARIQHNFNVFLTRQNKLKKLGAVKEFNLNRIRQYYHEMKRLSKDNPKRVLFMQYALTRAFAYNMPATASVQEIHQAKENIASIYGLIKNEIVDTPTLYEKIMRNENVKRAASAAKVDDAEEFVNYLEITGYRNLKEVLTVTVEQDTLYTNCLWKLGKYCDESLSRVGTSSMIQSAVEPIEYSKVVIDSYMKAMDRGHKRAAERFPRILELVELYPEIGSSFVECSENFGSIWLYIRWIPQMVSILDLPIAKYMYPVIKTMAENYPKALYYPFHISYEHYRLVDNKLSEENKKYIEEIRALIRSPVMEEFCTELRRLTNPEHIVKDFIDFLQSIIANENVTEDYIQELYQSFSQLLLNPYSSKLGSIPKAFAQKHGSHLIEIMGRNGAKLKNLNRDILKKLAAYVDDVIMKQKPSSRSGADLLKSYSPWLASFKSSEFEEQLEVPGQYNGLSKPYPELHAKVASIDGRVLVMSSIRKPKRIRIYGTDEKEYLFLVKGGEDLRLDQRIEQVFTVMNDMVSKNSFCSSQNIQISTYNVIPMTTSLGLIEWVDNTKPLRACIEEQVDTPARISHMQDKYRSWMAQKGGKGILGYQKAFSLPREQIAEHYREVSVLIKRTLLRDYLMKLAASPEAFLFLRKDFAHSLACISIFGYILGIGDRHLENFLLDMKSGRLIPIDFGHAFGSATEILPIPEIVPFRLTQQLVGALEPLGVSGILEIAMVNVLEAIQNDKDLLLNIMDIFVKEPLLDWKKAAVKQAKHQKTERGSSVSRENSLTEPSSSSSTTDEIKWYPQKKLETAKRKLEGDNPVDIVVDELTNGHAKFTYYESACKVAQGERTENIRAKLLGKRCADPKEQVQCLIDLATDPAVLGLMWIGWQSFL